jgi:predicted Zn-dependent protease
VFQQADSAFTGAIQSFRPLSAAEAENIRPNRVDLYVVRAGDTWQGIAERSGGVIKPTTLAIMNRSVPGSQPQPGARIKIVVGG